MEDFETTKQCRYLSRGADDREARSTSWTGYRVFGSQVDHSAVLMSESGKEYMRIVQ